MKKVILFIILLINLHSSNSNDILLDIQNKIAYALNCNAKFSSISEVEINNYKLLSETDKYELYEIFGIYKSVLSISFNFKGFGIGDEFHPISGSFKAKVKIDKETTKINIKEIFYKISFKKGYVTKQCLLKD